ncbi:MAG: non-ribosomal peptide synthetase, partial [Candidatus Dormibacteraeota bacterium]|nr:non-ribosomal peptide synthetase [Candidatus Dormibacteraeota bacterium]
MVGDSERLSAAKRALLERQLRGELGRAPKARSSIRGRARGGQAPLSHGQRQIWFMEQLTGGFPVYNESLAVLCPPGVDEECLERAFNEVLRRHQAWRTVFRGQDGEPVQVVLPPRIHRLPVADLSALPAAEAEAEARRLAERDAKASFDLEEGPLWRALLVRLPSGERRLQLTLFHAIFDGVSIYQVLLPELRTLHDAFLAGRPAELPEPEVQYPDFAVWEREFVGGPEARSQVDWWRQQLAGLP